MAQHQGTALSDTEQLIVAYLSSNPPDEGMLDKIAMGTGKSRATVLKYLGSLHARGILDYRILGRNKLWMVKQQPLPQDRSSDDTPAGEITALAARASELHASLLRQAELETLLDSLEKAIFTVLDDTTIVVSNRLAGSLFSGAKKFSDLLRPEGIALMEKKISRKRAGLPVSAELDLREKTGVLRRYLVRFVVPDPGGASGCTVIIAEDLASRRRSKRDLASLLYIIRAAGTTRTEDELLRIALKGIRENLVPYRSGMVVLGESRVAYTTGDSADQDLAGILSLMTLCRNSLATVAVGKNDPAFLALPSAAGSPGITGAVAIPVIEGEQAVGAIFLSLDTEISATGLGNIEIIADEIANVLKMQRLDREKNEYIRTLLAINRLSGILNEERDEDTLLGRAVESVMDTLGFEMGCVYLRDEQEDLIPRAQKNMPESLKKMCAAGVFRDLFGRAMTSKAVIAVTPGMPDFSGLDPAVRKSQLRTMLIIPIRIGDSVEGLLNMGSRSERQYPQTSLENIASLGLQLGTALERSRLARKLEHQNR